MAQKCTFWFADSDEDLLQDVINVYLLRNEEIYENLPEFGWMLRQTTRLHMKSSDKQKVLLRSSLSIVLTLDACNSKLLQENVFIQAVLTNATTTHYLYFLS